jgi:hypothetical protein
MLRRLLLDRLRGRGKYKIFANPDRLGRRNWFSMTCKAEQRHSAFAKNTAQNLRGITIKLWCSHDCPWWLWVWTLGLQAAALRRPWRHHDPRQHQSWQALRLALAAT